MVFQLLIEARVKMNAIGDLTFPFRKLVLCFSSSSHNNGDELQEQHFAVFQDVPLGKFSESARNGVHVPRLLLSNHFDGAT